MSRGGEPVRTVRVRIEGRVQGVGYRYWVERTADAWGSRAGCATAATARSRPCSRRRADEVADMLERCRQGPPAARVTSVTVLEEGVAGIPAGFDVLPTA